MAADQRRARVDRQGSEGGGPNCRPRKFVHKAKGLERLERAMEIRACALRLLGERGCWTRLYHGPEVLRFADSCFSIIFYVKPLVPLELRERFRIGPLGWGLYGLELWDRQSGKGKVLNINWQTAGAVPRIVTFKRGDWEQALILHAR